LGPDHARGSEPAVELTLKLAAFSKQMINRAPGRHTVISVTLIVCRAGGIYPMDVPRDAQCYLAG